MTTLTNRKGRAGGNPILTKELRTRMRGARAFWILFVYLFLLSAILFVTYLSWWQSQRGELAGQGGAFTIGKTFYYVLFSVQAVLVGLITPALTAGGVSIEKEQRTYELLSVSLLPRRSIVLGKLTAAVSFVILLLTSSLPLVSIGFLLGGISPSEVTAAFVLLVMTAFLYGAIGIACSAIAKSTATATVMAYGAIMTVFFATVPLTALAIPGFFGPPGALGGQSVALTALNPIGAVSGGTVQETIWGVHLPAWATALIMNGLLAAIFTLVAVHRLEYPRSDRSALLRGLTALFVGLSALCLYSMAAPGGLASSFSGTGFIVAFTLALPYLVVPIFATGEGLPSSGLIRAFFDPRRLFKGEAPSGLVYCLLLVGLCLAIYTWGLGWAGTHGNQAMFKQTGPGAVTPLPSSGTGASLSTMAVTQASQITGALFGLTAAAVFFFGAWGVFFSALTGNRWSALSVTATVMVLFSVLPPMVTAGREVTGKTQGSVWDNVSYLSPLPGAIDLVTHSGRGSYRESVNPSLLLFGNTPFYTATPFVYLAGGFLLLIAAGRVDVFRKKRDRARLEKSDAMGTDERDFAQAKQQGV